MGGSERVDNHVQDKLGLLVEVYNILDKDSLLFNYTANFVPESSAEGLLKTDKNFLKLEYQYYQNCDKNLFGPGCSKYCALTHTYRCDISGNKICTLKCGATDTCTWDKGEDQFHCACDKEKGCTETKSYHKVCPKNFCRYGHKVCYREAKVCICEMPKMKRSSCYFLNDLILPAHIAPDPVKNTSESLHSTPKRQPASKGPISHPNATNNQSGNSLSGVIIFLLVFLSISILVLVVVVSWKICKERQMRQEFDYGRMGGNSRQRIALDDMEDDFHPPMEEPSVQYVASQPVHNGRYDAEPIIPE